MNSGAKLLLRLMLIACIAVAHMRAIFDLYPTGHSDVVRFMVPTAVALGLYLIVLARKHLVLKAALALVLTGLSFWGGMVVAVNTYGS
jgi:hypothetical protein